MAIIHCGMDDVGRRLDHLMQLQDVWGAAYAILTTKGWNSAQEVMQAEELEIALTLLARHMQNDYSELRLAREVNEIPKPTTNNSGESEYTCS